MLEGECAMASWLLKSDPDTYGWQDLERDRTTRWDGVANNLALRHLRDVKAGDSCLIYHSGAEKAIVGLATATRDGYPDPRDAKLTVVDLEVVRRLKQPVTLAQLKADAAFAAFALVRMPRLSVMPVPAPLYARILRLAGEKE
jgi:predicted RNA-binding protein with PUA-like domain